ncbi:uncharacterized protein LOC131946539 [Physella acuta]|uniref:uncharacterized protein LOC131946539 n=1 Tax=Physella acuta TaxID=109671 RepID=UPI0027DD3470|nr:uncharacterized protein LOC131946539 [Physella acuta]XP_059163368.1 uncharacterized protein LOC131946539 [Physella acuta]
MASNTIDVYVKLPSGRNTFYSTVGSANLHSICELIAKEEHIKSSQVILKYQGKILDNNKSLNEYGIRAETILKVEILVPQMLDILVSFPEGTEQVAISNLEPVSALYDAVATKLCSSRSQVEIKVEGRLVTPSSYTLHKTGFTHGTCVTAAIKKEVPKATSCGDQPAPVIDDETKQSVMNSFDAKGRRVEVAFSFDTTGSMYQYLSTVRQKLQQCCTRLLQDIPQIRISLIAQGDYCDSESSYAVRSVDLTSDVQTLVHFAQNVPATGGGDAPECYELVLKKAQLLDWSEDSAKALVVIGDLHPHPPSYTDQRIWWRDELNVLTGMGVKVYGVQAGTDSVNSHFYRELAEVSGGCYLNLNHIDVITDMFLAVCYNETNDDMLQDFEEELVAQGHMTELKQNMISQLKQKNESKSRTHTEATNTTKHNVCQPWWDLALDTGTPFYTYDGQTDKWSPVLQSTTSVHCVPAVSSEVIPVTRSLRKKYQKCKCSVM